MLATLAEDLGDRSSAPCLAEPGASPSHGARLSCSSSAQDDEAGLCCAACERPHLSTGLFLWDDLIFSASFDGCSKPVTWMQDLSRTGRRTTSQTDFASSSFLSEVSYRRLYLSRRASASRLRAALAVQASPAVNAVQSTCRCSLPAFLTVLARATARHLAWCCRTHCPDTCWLPQSRAASRFSTSLR